ncbi:MAG TPA: ZIP family metal transporter [Chthoniobacterales bacterium]|nr:ZIP family metal transporter [Chthoniobacterales bacterium]
MDGNVIVWQIIAAYLFALTGGAVSAAFRLSHQVLCGLISFAAGTLFGVTLFTIGPETLHFGTWWMVGLAAASGYLLFFLISRYVHHVCPACAASHFDADATRHFSDIAFALIAALAIHSTSDGIAIGVGHDIHASYAGIWSLFAALCIHKVPEGLALGSLLIGAGFKRATAFAWVALTEATTLAGGAIGYFLLDDTSMFWLTLLMAHVGGGFVYLATHAVIGELLRHGKQLVITSFLMGIALIAFVNLWLKMLALR